MKTLLTVNLTTKTANLGSEEWAPPSYRFGEELTLALRFTETRGAAIVEPVLAVASMRAAIGRVDTRPESGKFALQFGAGAQTEESTTAEVPHDCSPAALLAAITALTEVTALYGAPVVAKLDDSWRIVFGDGAEEVDITARDNTLFPVSFVRVSAYQIDGVWQHFVRLLQSEIAFTTAGAAVLPDPPRIAAVQDGGSDGEFTWNEIQALNVPPDFRGSFLIRSGENARTRELTTADTAETIQTALETMIGAGNVKVTESVNFTANIEFTGELEGTDIELMTVAALNPPPGDLTFTLALDRAELEVILRRVPSVTLPLEVRLVVTLPGETTQTMVAFSTEVTLLRPLIWPEQATIEPVDWLRPPSPTDYVPRSSDTVFTGDKSAVYIRGNGAATEFVLDHDFATSDVTVEVVQNISNGLQLVNGTHYTARIVNDGSVEVEAIGAAPTTNAWRIYVRAMEPIAAFADGLTVTIEQVTGESGDLRTILDSFGARLGVVEDKLPEVGAQLDPATVIKNTLQSRVIPDFLLVTPRPTKLPGATITDIVPQSIKATELASSGSSVESTYTGTRALSSQGELVRYAPLSYYVEAELEVTAKTDEVLEPDAAEIGKVYAVDGDAVFAAGVAGRGRKRFADGSFIAFANGHWFEVVEGDEDEWWPVECEATLFLVTAGAEDFITGTYWEVLFDPQFALASREHLAARGTFVLEAAELPAELGLDDDIDALTWTPLVDHTRTFSDALTKLKGTLRIDRTDPVEIGEFTAAADDVITVAVAHERVAGQRVFVLTDDTLPPGLEEDTGYYVMADGLGEFTMKVEATLGGGAVNITGTGTGTHTILRDTLTAVAQIGGKSAINTQLSSAHLAVRLRFTHFDVAAADGPRGAFTLALSGATDRLVSLT